jgi:hypothetical protein
VIGIQEGAVITPTLGRQQARRDALQDIVMTVPIAIAEKIKPPRRKPTSASKHY